MDEVFVKIGGVQHYLWRAIDRDGEAVDVFLQKSHNSIAAKRFFTRLYKTNKGKPRKIVTDNLASHGVVHRELSPDVIHDESQYANSLSELSHQLTRVRERVMRRFKSLDQAQRFLDSYSSVFNLINLQRHCIRAKHYRCLRASAFAEWNRVIA